MKLLNQSLTKNNIVMRMFSKKWIWILFLLLISVLIRSFHFYDAGPGFFPDSTQYLSMASNLIDHHKLESFGAMFPDIMRPILYPIIVAIFYLFSGNILLSGVLVSLIAGCLSVVAVYYVANELFDSTVGKIAGLIAALNPTLVTVSTYCLTDSLSLLFLLFAYLFGLKLINNDRYIYAVYSGLFFALGFLTRQIVEIHIYAFLVFYSGVLICRRKYYSLLKNMSLLVISVAIVVSPYIYHNYRETGQIIFNTGKDYYGVKDYVLTHKINDGFYQRTLNCYKNVTDNFKRQLEGEIMFRALNDSNDDLLAFDYYYKVIRPINMISIYKMIRKETITNLYNNIYNLFSLFWYSFGVIIGFFILGVYQLLNKRRYLLLLFILFAVLADLLSIFQGHLEDRYAINILVFITIVTAFGMANVFQLIKCLEKGRIVRTLLVTAMVGSIFLSLVFIPLKYKNSINSVRRENETLFRITYEFKDQIIPDSKVASRWPTYVFFLKGKYFPLPIGDFNSTIEYLDKKNVDYLIMDPPAIQTRPFFTISNIEESLKYELQKKILINNEYWYLYKRSN